MMTLFLCLVSALCLKTPRGIWPYPENRELEKFRFPESWIQVQTISPDDVDSSFSNFDDLTWLRPIAKQNKVFLLGESHYYHIIHNLRNRVLFALNTFDHYHLILLELQYSYSGYFDYYVGIVDDNEARRFYENVMYEMVTKAEIYTLLEHLRRWNRLHPDKRIHIGGYDIEHDYVTTLRHIIIPYFQSLDPNFKPFLDRITFQDLEALLPKLEKRLQEAEAKNFVGDYPFLTPQYIRSILENLKSTYYAKQYDFKIYRQRAMIRNLTDPLFFGNFFLKGKVMIHAGSAHIATHFRPKGGNFLCEGSYLSFDFKPTKGKTYSVRVQGLAYLMGVMADVNLDSCLHHGTYYRSIIEKFQRAYRRGLVSPNKYYLYKKPNVFNKIVLKLAYEYDHLPMLITKVEWDKVIKALERLSVKAFVTLLNEKSIFNRYDANIFVPKSPITRVKRIKE